MLHDEPNYFTAHFVMNRNHDVFSRSNYTLLALLGDVGAVLDTLQKICAFLLLSIFKIGVLLENHLISGIFKKGLPNYKVKKIRLSYCNWLCWVLCFPLCFMKRNEQNKIRDVGNRRIERELDV